MVNYHTLIIFKIENALKACFQNKILRKEITFNDKNKMSEVKYLSNDGFCYLSYWYGDNENIVNIFYFDKIVKKY